MCEHEWFHIVGFIGGWFSFLAVALVLGVKAVRGL